MPLERREVRGKSSVQHAIVFLDRESVDAKVRKPNFPHSYKEYQSTWTHDEIVERLKDADIAIINKVDAAEPANIDIVTGDWRPLNLERPPFGFPPAHELINEQCSEGNGAFRDKSLGLWRIADLPTS